MHLKSVWVFADASFINLDDESSNNPEFKKISFYFHPNKLNK